MAAKIHGLETPVGDGQPGIMVYGRSLTSNRSGAMRVIQAINATLSVMLRQPSLTVPSTAVLRKTKWKSTLCRYEIRIDLGRPLPERTWADYWAGRRRKRANVATALRGKTAERLLLQILGADRSIRAALAAGLTVTIGRHVSWCPYRTCTAVIAFWAHTEEEDIELSAPTALAFACMTLRAMNLALTVDRWHRVPLIITPIPSATLRACTLTGNPDNWLRHRDAIKALAALGLGELAGALVQEANAPVNAVS